MTSSWAMATPRLRTIATCATRYPRWTSRCDCPLLAGTGACSLRALASQDTFLDAKHLESCFPGRAVTYTNVEAGAVPVPPFRVTFPELLPDATAAATGKQTAADGAVQAEGADASLEPLQVEVRQVLTRRARASARAGSRRYALLPMRSALRKTHISTESF